ncbi:AraC family transcriptional regulator [Streptomyces sp. ZEA17I]|nr:AraC family transcriptional regulator [Streptomyces sp. ZEA17I]
MQLPAIHLVGDRSHVEAGDDGRHQPDESADAHHRRGVRQRVHLGVINLRLLPADITALQLPTARDPRLTAACRLVLKDLSQPRILTWPAGRVGVGERQSGRLLLAEFGGTCPEWRANARILQAMIELSEGATVTQAAHRCGWATPSAFIDTFTRVMGRTPGSYRR